MTRERLFRAFVVVAGLAMLWAVLVMWTGGIQFRIAGMRISSRGHRNSVALSLLSVVVACLLAPAGQRRSALTAKYAWLAGIVTRRMRWLAAIPQPARVVTTVAAVTIVIVGVTEGAFVAVASDSYGYVSQAHLWTIGTLRQAPALSGSLPPDISLDVMSPLGYRPSADGMTIAPTYSPGLPIVMAVFETLFGPDSIFWVVPILGGVLVWATYLLGSRLHGPLVGAVAAVLVATSPPVLMQLTAAPMSDLPAAAWWTLALALVSLDRRDGAFAAGAATGLAILTRPNLVPLAAIVGGLLIWRLVAARPLPAARRPLWIVVQHTMLFACCPIAACVAIAAVNRSLWGSALTSGYGSVSHLFNAANIWPNVWLYPRVIATEMPAVLLLPIAAVLQRGWLGGTSDGRRLAIALWSFVVVLVLLYIAYPPFDSSSNLRFLLPAVSPLLVLASVAMLALAGPLLETHRAACIAVLLIVSGYGVDYARDRSSFNTGHLRRYAEIGDYITDRLPKRAVLLAMLHSGSATYYTGRPTLRWDLLPPSRLDGLVSELTQRGYVPYLLLDHDERGDFQSRYRDHSRLAALDWPPLVTLKPVEVQIYALPAQP